jgi:sporulation protein YlmC with PRC-barrel domain
MRYAIPLGAVLVAATVFAVSAADKKVKPQPTDDQATETREQDRLKKHDDSEPVRVSEMIGMNVHNKAGEEIGEVNDIVLDIKQGKVRYVALSVGGFLNIGDKLFAVPWKSFKCEKSEDGTSRTLLLNIDKKRLEGAPGFNQDNWPDFANREFTELVDKYYSGDGVK